jgi:hypothetical protein
MLWSRGAGQVGGGVGPLLYLRHAVGALDGKDIQLGKLLFGVKSILIN